MKLATTLAAGSIFLGAALAVKPADNVEQIVGKLTQCAQTCLASALSDNDCNAADYDCLCSKFVSVTLSMTTCLSADCALSNREGE